SNKDKPPTLADVLDEVRALRKEVALVKFDDARILKLERILNDNFMFRNDISPNGNHNAVNQGLSGSDNHPMSTCSCPDIDNAEVAGHVIGIHKADRKNDSPHVAGGLIGIHKADGKNDSPNVNHNAVNKGLSSSFDDPMSTCSSHDMDNGEVFVAGMVIHKADGQNDIPNANDNAVNQGIISSANDPMVLACDGMGIDKADGNNDYTYSQREPSTLDVLVQGFDSQKNHPGIDVLQHDTHVDCSVAKLNDHPTTDIGVKAVPVDEFVDDYMDVLYDEECIPDYSLDDMKHGFCQCQSKEEEVWFRKKLRVKVCKERNKRLAMSLDSPFGQQATTTPTPPKTISRSVNGDFIAPLEFLEHLDLWIDLMWYPVAWRDVEKLSIDGGSITSAPSIMTMPFNHFLKLLGFNNHDLPIVEAATGHIMGHTVQVYIGNSQSFKNVAIQGNSGFWSGGLMSDVDLVKVFSHGL
ncbi:hypothetical protein Tco_1303649, partial [Tanacetum coccineum]